MDMVKSKLAEGRGSADQSFRRHPPAFPARTQRSSSEAIGLCRSATRAPKPSVDCGCIRSQLQLVLRLGVFLFGMLRNHGIKRKTHRYPLDEVAAHCRVGGPSNAVKWFSHVRVLLWF